jgi:SAM-dependent MidA family methyltransferase
MYGENAERSTPNAEYRSQSERMSEFSPIGRSTFGVRRFLVNPQLVDLIRETIRARGSVPFAWFMEQALYHPEHGYYSSGRAAIGRSGDYFTNVSVGPLFGQLLTAQFVEIWERLGKPDEFEIVEEGAHHGDFARDVLECARERFPEFFGALRYRIVEPFAALQDRQSKTLEGRPPCRPKNSGTGQRPSLQDFRNKVQWRKTLTPFTGVHFSNELLDALPINLRGKQIGLDGDEFVFVDVPDDPRARPNQAVLGWIDTVAANMQRGSVIVVDYGHSRSHFRESVQVRSQHRHLSSPFEQIGHADITMHVNWTDIAEHAEANGLRVAGFTDQHHFLAGILSESGRGGSPNRPSDWGQSPLPSTDSTRGLQTLLHPEMLGRTFQVLALAKDIDLSQPLCGFKFARDPRVALELTAMPAP